MSSNWIDQMSQQMEHHEVEAPKGLWEDIAQGIEARKRGKRAKLVWAWRAGAAAAVAAGVVVGVQVWNASEKEGDVPLAQTEQPKPIAPTPILEKKAPGVQGVASLQPNVASALSSMAPASPNVASVQSNMATTLPSIATRQSVAVTPSTQDAIIAATEVDASKVGETIINTPPPATPKNDAPLLAETNTDEAEEVYIVNVSREKESGVVPSQLERTKHHDNLTKRRVSFQLMAMATGDFSQDYDCSYMADATLGVKNPADSVNMESQRRMQSERPARSFHLVNTDPLYGEHEFPVKVGVTFRVPLGRRFAFDGGLSYARMRSGVTFFTPMSSRGNKGTQLVNYLGVPVTLTADLWQSHRWNVYASAGGEVAKSVRTTWSTTEGQSYDVAERPWQWSVSAAVGVQFNVTQHVGLYAQPSADYYFDNHSMVQTYYTEHPFTPALRMGVRVKL